MTKGWVPEVNSPAIGFRLGVTGKDQARAILLVEDEPVVREITKQVLEQAGYYVLESCGADEAMRKAAEYPGEIALLLTDVVMPGMNGPDLAQHLSVMHPGLGTVFMSGYAESEVLRSTTRYGALIHIQKPFTVQFLLSRVAEAWQRRSSHGRGEDSASRSL